MGQGGDLSVTYNYQAGVRFRVITQVCSGSGRPSL